MRSRTKRYTAGVLLTLLLTMVLSACGGNQNNAETEQNTAENAQASAAGTATETTGEPKDEGTLTVYLNDFDDIIADMFEQATGYKVNLVTGNGAELMSRIEAEKGNPHWDVIWADMMPSINALGEQGQLLEGWIPNNESNLTETYRSYVPENQSYYPTGAHAAGVIVYNTNKFSKDQAPKTWADFAKPEYKGQIATADPAIAAPAYPFVARFFEQAGMDGGKELFDAWFTNGLRVYPKNPQVVQALSSGEVSIAALQESNAYSMLTAGEPIDIVWPEEGAPASVRVAAIQKDTKNPNAAKAFIEFLLDPNTQQQLIDQGEEAYFEPSVSGAKPKENRDPNAKLVAADAAWAAEHEAEIKQWFADKAVK
ncbi:extracellular solute-binding protein [Paenibacillus timonensis]|nr:extracellular solute-binding protein [Paenibacillus timonensis]MUG86383.1 extracellular solute-binding protein [Paenibacillus timonensis]